MKRAWFGLVVAVLVGHAAAGQASEQMFVSVEAPTLETAATLLADDIMVVRDLERYLLVVVDDDGLARLAQRALTYSILDQTVADKSYYIVALRNQDQMTWLESRARILRRDDFEAVIEATPDEADFVSRHGLDIAKVFMRPLRLSSPPEVHYETRDEADPVIQSLVDQVSFLQVDGYVQRLQDFESRYASHDSCLAASQWLAGKFQSFGITDVYFHDFSGSYHDNVVAVIPGVSEPEKIVVIGAHYDSTAPDTNNCPGADDDASGTACVVEAARVLAAAQFDYTIKFVCFCAEEQGLIGSYAFAEAAANAGEDIVGAVCVDMIGYVAPGDAIDLDIVDNAGSQWMRDLAVSTAGLYVPALSVVDGSLPFGASSDHASFWNNGYDAILFFEDTGDYSPYIHTANDVVGISYNNSVLAERSVKAAVGLIATMARPFRISVIHDPLANTEDITNPYQVLAEITTNATLLPDSLIVYYATTNPGFEETLLTPTGNPDEFEAFIPAQGGGTFVDYYLLAVDDDGNRVTHPLSAPDGVHSFFVGSITPLVEHDFEADQGWTVGAAGDDATTGIWTRVDPVGSYEEGTMVQPEDDHTPAPGVMCFITGNAAPGQGQGENDVDDGRTTLLSPVFDLSGRDHAGVRYFRWYTNNTGFSPNADSWVVEVSNDGWQTWASIENTTTSERVWKLVELDLADLITLTDQVQLRFIAADEGDGSVVEAGVDDFAILEYQEPETGVGETMPGAAVVLRQNTPNPFNPRTTIRFSVPQPGQSVSLKLYDLGGRLVRTLVADELLAGAQQIVWDGTDDGGREVSTGVYFCRVQWDAGSVTRKLTLIR